MMSRRRMRAFVREMCGLERVFRAELWHPGGSLLPPPLGAHDKLQRNNTTAPGHDYY